MTYHIRVRFNRGYLNICVARPATTVFSSFDDAQTRTIRGRKNGIQKSASLCFALISSSPACLFHIVFIIRTVLPWRDPSASLRGACRFSFSCPEFGSDNWFCVFGYVASPGNLYTKHKSMLVTEACLIPTPYFLKVNAVLPFPRHLTALFHLLLLWTILHLLQAANKSMVADAVLKLLSTPQSLSERGEVDFILCVGDDRSDEDMFQTVKRFRDHARESPTPVLSPTSEDEVGRRV